MKVVPATVLFSAPGSRLSTLFTTINRVGYCRPSDSPDLSFMVECMYLRFVVPEIDDDSERGLGIFQAVYRLRDQGKLYAYEETHLQTLREWFNTHLEKPTR